MSDCVPGTDIPKPEVELDNGNAISIMMKVKRALRRAGVPTEVCDKFQKEAMSGDYDHVLQTAMDYAEV